MTFVLADTHAIYWYLHQPERLSATAERALDEAADSGNLIYVSVMTLIELRYLIEKGRMPTDALRRLNSEIDEPDVAVTPVPVDIEVARSIDRIPRDIVPDMPDRIIAGTALHLDVPLVTHDRQLRAAPIRTIW